MFARARHVPMLLAVVGCAHQAKGPMESMEQPGPASVTCTKMACTDQLSVELRNTGEVWAAGEYLLTVNLNLQGIACPFALPKDLPEQGGITSVACVAPDGKAPTEPVQVMITQQSECRELAPVDGIGQRCDPIPERYAIQISIPGTPGSVGVDLQRDGVPVFQKSYDPPTYEETRPNGPLCEPVCRQANEVETL
jgi:hypothetical protein